ncbi:hypothetical protein HOY82DRAFT_521963 [Tuber indicum]|nr:hypothetical protein HOY82DRAFT_521963 [Tuber indicum]
MSHYITTPTPATTRASISAPDTASVCSLASTVSVDWENEKRGNIDPPAAATLAPAAVERRGETGTKTGSLIIRNLFIIGFLIPLAWVIAIIKVFILDRGNKPSPSAAATTTTATSAGGHTDIEANTLRKKEGRYREGPYWACLCLIAGMVYISVGMTIVWIVYVEKQRRASLDE